MLQNTRHTTRRTVLASIGGLAAGGTSIMTATATRSGQGNGQTKEFPPEGITEQSPEVPLGEEGTVNTFASVTPSGTPKYVGVRLSDGSLDAPSTPESNLIPVPDSAPAPFTNVAIGWTPQSYATDSRYNESHFGIHFYFNDRVTIANIDGGRIEDIHPRIVPDGYMLDKNGTIVPGTGAYLSPKPAPEHSDGESTHLLRWGAADVDSDDAYELHFIEPLITTSYLDSLTGATTADIPQPDIHPQKGWYPTSYAIRTLDEGGYAIVLQDFVQPDSV